MLWFDTLIGRLTPQLRTFARGGKAAAKDIRMQISLAAFAAAIVLLFGVPLMLVAIYRRNSRFAIWLSAGIVVFIVLGNAVEKLTIGHSGLF